MVLRWCWLYYSRVEKMLPRSDGWSSPPQRTFADLDPCCKDWPGKLLSILWQGTPCPLLSCPLCASGPVVHCTGISNWRCPVLIHALQGQTTLSCDFSLWPGFEFSSLVGEAPKKHYLDWPLTAPAKAHAWSVPLKPVSCERMSAAAWPSLPEVWPPHIPASAAA